ncbi:MAG: hypothetical protein IT462_16810 [Planctomycetes bacterium]|nr:hypothetical protein [Planctomycetota bacterium]
MKRLLIAAVFVIVSAQALAAQDYHYWTHQYGSKSALMGGAVRAGVDDTSAGYYNPARLAFISNESLSASASLYQVDVLSVENGAGTGTDLRSQQARIVPLLASGILLLKAAPRHAFGFNIVARQYWSVFGTARRSDDVDIIPEARSPGMERYVGQFKFRGSLNEFWAGLSYAYRFDDHFAIGATHYAALRLQDQDVAFVTRAVNVGNFDMFGADNIADVGYYNVRMLWKVGFSADLGDFKAAATLTTASLNMFGSGSVGRNVTFINLDNDNDGTGDSFVADDRQENMQTQFRSPWAFGIGIEYKFRSNTRLTTDMEWFLPVGRYSVMVPKDKNFLVGVPFDLSTRNQLRVDDVRRGCFNVGIGLEQQFVPAVSGTWSLRFDQSTRNEPEGEVLELGIASWNLVHVTTGVVIRSAKNEFSLGVQISIGTGKAFQAVDFSRPREDNLLVGTPGRAEQSYLSFAIIAGYTFYI